jgi:large subunit ribosomal protein L20
MPRVKRGVTAHARHKKIFKQAKGFRGKRKNVFKLAKNAVMKAGQNAYRDRRLKKRTFHQLWVLRINAACKELGIRYSRFIYGLELAGIRINRKMLSELATNYPEVFKQIVEKVKKTLPPEGQAPDLEDLKKRFGKTSPSPASNKAEEKAEAEADKADNSEKKEA